MPKAELECPLYVEAVQRSCARYSYGTRACHYKGGETCTCEPINLEKAIQFATFDRDNKRKKPSLVYPSNI